MVTMYVLLYIIPSYIIPSSQSIAMFDCRRVSTYLDGNQHQTVKWVYLQTGIPGINWRVNRMGRYWLIVWVVLCWCVLRRVAGWLLGVAGIMKLIVSQWIIPENSLRLAQVSMWLYTFLCVLLFLLMSTIQATNMWASGGQVGSLPWG